MKRTLIFLFWLLSTVAAFAQTTELTSDTLTRPRVGRYRIAVVNGQLRIVPATGYTIPIVGTGGGSGEVNTVTSLNQTGFSLFQDKLGAALRFKGIAAASNRVTLADDNTNKVITVDVNPANLTLPSTANVSGLVVALGTKQDLLLYTPVSTTNNLSDLSNPGLARSNLGLGSAATLNFDGSYTGLTGKPTIPVVSDGASSSVTVYSSQKVEDRLSTVSGGVSAAVRFDADQTLNSTQKTQARANIGAIDQSTADGRYPQLTGTYANPSWLTSLVFSKLTSLPSTISGYGITDAVGTGGSYSNPAWITALAASKITGLATVGTTGSYNDLTNKPTIPVVSDGASSTSTVYSSQKVEDRLSAVSSGASAAVRFDADQTLNSTQKTQARNNISAVDVAGVQSTGDARYPQLSGSYTNPSWLTSIPYSKLTSTPTTVSGFGITDAVSTGSSYSNPSWILSLGWSKLSSVPTTVSGYGITDGVSTGGSYSNPSWITALAAAKVTGLATVGTTGSASDLSTGTLPAGRLPAHTGDVTSSAGSAGLTLATVNSNVGSFGSATLIPVFTVNGKGLVTGVSTTTFSAGTVGAELSANKASNLTSPDNTKFPTTLAVQNALDTKPEIVSLATIRANSASTPPASIQVSDPNSAGLYYYDASDASSTDNTGTVVVTTGGKRYKRVVQNKSVDVKVFGATYGSGVSNSIRTANCTALTNALNAGGTEISGVLEVSACTVNITDKSVYLHGIGQYGIIRQMTDQNLLVINQTSANSETNIYDVTFEAGGVFTTGVAITHNGYSSQPSPDVIYQKPFGNFRNLLIKGQNIYAGAYTGWTHTWKKGMVLNVPNRISVKDVTINGVSGNNNTDGTIGIELATTRAAVETYIDNVQVVNMQTGLQVTQASSSPAIEGLHITNSSFITVWDGIRLLGSSGYSPPGFFIENCHVAAKHVCVDIALSRQGYLHNCLLYNFGNSTSGQDAAFVQMVNASDWNITNNRFYYQGGSTPTNKAYGILMAGSSGDFAVGNIIAQNYISLYVGDTKPAVWLQNYAVNNKIYQNYLNGGNASVVSNLPYNTIADNTPKDIIDGHVTAVKSTDGGAVDGGAWLSPISSSSANGYNLDISNMRGNMAIVPDLKIEAGSYLKTITMSYGQIATIVFNGTVRVQHNTGLFLKDAKDQTFYAGERLTVQGTSLGIYEISRNINEADYVFLDVSAGTSQTVNASRSEVYSVYNNTTAVMGITVDVSKMKLGQQVSFKRYSDASTGPIVLSVTGTYIQPTEGTFVTSFTLPTSESQQQLAYVTFALSTQGYLERVAGSASSGGTVAITTKSANYTLVASDCGKMLEFSAAATVTVPPSVLATGCTVGFLQTGTGQVTFSAGSGMTLNSSSSYTKTASQWSGATVLFRSTTTAALVGQISN